jgi:hypothetical protein
LLKFKKGCKRFMKHPLLHNDISTSVLVCQTRINFDTNHPFPASGRWVAAIKLPSICHQSES